MPPDFIRWLKIDGVSLPEATPQSLFCATQSEPDDSDDEWSDDEAPSSAAVETSKVKVNVAAPAATNVGEIAATPAATHVGAASTNGDYFDFTDLDGRVKSALASLGGSAFPKLNWSAPQDASWMNMGTLKVLQPGDAYVLLKASDFVTHDLESPFEGCSDYPGGEANEAVRYTLVLRKWSALRPERSFRCFIRQRALVGVSQRDCTAHFPQLIAERDGLRGAIVDFFHSAGRPRSSRLGHSELAAPAEGPPENTHGTHTGRSEGPLLLRYPDEDFAADVYVDKARKVRRPIRIPLPVLMFQFQQCWKEPPHIFQLH